MSDYYIDMGAAAPYDDSDEVIKNKKGATEPRNWQHCLARTIMAIIANDCQLRDAFSIRIRDQNYRINIVNEIINIISDSTIGHSSKTESIIEYLRSTDGGTDAQFREMLEPEELEQIMDNVDFYIEKYYQENT